jgi:hypothetical protein
MKHLKDFNQLTEGMVNTEQERIDKAKTELLDDPAIYNGILRKLMSSDEIKAANQLVKDGKLIKGRSAEKHGGIMYYLTER